MTSQQVPATAMPSGPSPRRIGVAGLSLTPLTMQTAGDIVEDAIEQERRITAAFCTAHTVVEAQNRPEFQQAINATAIAATDGMPLVWLCRLRGAGYAKRVYGPDALIAFCERGLSKGWRHYFYGGSQREIDDLTSRLKALFPGLQVVGAYSPPFRALTDEEKQEDVARINAARPDLVWVGLGNPKQELWMQANRPLLEAPAILAVGAAFAFHSGQVKQAPLWMQRSGTEWLYRFVQEPRRLWKRYLVGNTRFLWLVTLDTLGLNTKRNAHATDAA